MAWIFNTLLGPGELPNEDEKDAQAYFDREYAPLDKELMELHQWFWGAISALNPKVLLFRRPPNEQHRQTRIT
jgi:hypothetical protein